MFPTRRITAVRFATLSLAAITLAFSSGCDNTKERLTALESENRDLRSRIDSTDAARRQAESEAALLREENNRLQTAAPTGSDWGTGDFSSGSASRSQDVVISLAGDLLFESGQVTLKQSAKAKLDQVARDLNSTYSGRRIRVVGHTDSDPIRKSKWKSNDELSFARAQAVADYLATRNVSRGRIAVVGKGASEPKATKAASRRVEVIVLGN